MRLAGKIVDSLHRILIRHPGHVEVLGFQESGEQQIIRTGNRGIVQLAGLGFDLAGQFFHRGNAEIGGHTECDQCIGHARDGYELFRIVRQLLVQQWVSGKR